MSDWQAISGLVRRLKRDVERAYYECRDDDAGELHDELTSAEWRMRQAQKRERGRDGASILPNVSG